MTTFVDMSHNHALVVLFGNIWVFTSTVNDFGHKTTGTVDARSASQTNPESPEPTVSTPWTNPARQIGCRDFPPLSMKKSRFQIRLLHPSGGNRTPLWISPTLAPKPMRAQPSSFCIATTSPAGPTTPSPPPDPLPPAPYCKPKPRVRIQTTHRVTNTLGKNLPVLA